MALEKKTQSAPQETEQVPETDVPSGDAAAAEAAAATEAILDEIDDVLEENAEEFVRGYVQKGGE